MQHTLNNALPIVATALGRRFGVNVVIGGTHAETDGKTIWLPDLPPDSALREVAWGFLAHEASHVRHTDMEIFSAMAAKSPIQKHLLNILEDIRIERAIRHTYPGTQSTLEAVIEWLIAEGKLIAPRIIDHPAQILMGYLHVNLRVDVLGQNALISVAKQSEQVLYKTFPSTLVNSLQGLMHEVWNLTSTADAANLTDKILNLLKTEDQLEEETTDTNIYSKLCDEQIAKLSNLSLAMNADALVLDEDLFTTARTWLAHQTKDQHDLVRLPAGEEAEVDIHKGTALMNKVRSESCALSATLQGIVQANRRDRQYTTHKGKKLVGNRLYRAGIADTRLFAHHTTRKAPDTAVHLLIDLSGSMQRISEGKQLGATAQQATLALATALDTIPGVSVAVTAFPGINGDNSTVSCLIQHGQRPSARAGAFLQAARGDTPLAQGVRYAMVDLMLRKEPRRVLLVITDGVPNDTNDALTVLGQAQQAGIEIAGMGIGFNVSHLFKRHVTLESITDLKQTAFTLAEQFLV